VLHKWYLDVVTDGGDVAIVYPARLRRGAVRAAYASTIEDDRAGRRRHRASIASNIAVGTLLVRLRTAHSDALVVGTVLMLGGTARFVHESYLAGIVCTTLRPVQGPSGFALPDARLIAAALAMAAIAARLACAAAHSCRASAATPGHGETFPT
jgi:hypothetical protein